MKNCFLIGTIALFACGSLIGLAQDGTKPAGAKPAKAEKPADPKEAGAKKGRLPANYGKLGLTEAQKTKIYGIQSMYEEQLDSLEKQLAALKSKRDGEVEAVLTADQQKILANLVATAKEAKAKKTETTREDATKAPTEAKK